MRVLYVGGTGEISFSCVEASVRLGHEVWVYNRGNRNEGLPASCRFLRGDVRDDVAYGAAARMGFDVVCQFRLFEPEEVRRDVETFAGRCGQYIFISSASAYRKPVRDLPLTEGVPLDNPYWPYAAAKAEMEAILAAQDRLPWTVVRPSHTYRTRLPGWLGWNVDASRLLRGKPVVLHGDGQSLWTVTHAEDFARPFARLLGREEALGQAFHVTAERAWPWNEIVEAGAAALGVADPDVVHVPTDTLIRYEPAWRGPLLGDKAWSVLFDNAKVRSVVGDFDCPIDPWRGMAKVAERFPPDAQAFDPATDALLDRIAAEQSALGRA
jgi:nucleoside-diphosphate-sugar epimerase